MTWKKNCLSIILWVLQTVITAFLLTGTCGLFIDKFQLADKYQIVPGYNRIAWLVAISVLICLVLLVVYFLFRLIRRRTGDLHIPGAAKAAMEGLLFVGLFTGAIFLRMYQFPVNPEMNAYYELAEVTAAQTAIPMAHGILYVYILLLRALFLVVGNHITIGIILQLTVHFFAAMFLYASVRKMAGAFTALWTLVFLLFAPAFVNASLSYSPVPLFLLFLGALLLCLLKIFDNIKKNGKMTVGLGIGCILCGLLFATVTYLDALGLIPVIMCLALVSLKTQHEDTTKQIGFLAVLFLLIGAIAGLLGIFAIDAYSCNSDIATITGVWEWLFRPEIINLSYTYHQIFEKLSSNLYWTIPVFGGLIFSCYTFWNNRKQEKQTILHLMVIASVMLSYVCSAAGNMDRSFPAYLALIILAGKGVALLMENTATYEVSDEIISEEAVIEEVVAEESVHEDVPVVEPVREIKYIENPLPLPKKHVKKRMDYAMEPAEEELFFDVEIEENDDFDIQ